MTHLRILFLTGSLAAAVALRAAGSDSAAGEVTKTNSAVHLVPGPNDGRIAWVTAKILEQNHYLQHPFDDTISEKFYDHYLEALDPQHVHFLQSDLAEFDHYRTNLDNLTLMTQSAGNTMPAFEIFNRFIERLRQHVAFANDLLKNGKFEFNTNERMLVNRHEAPYPRDLNEAQDLWRQRLRWEYLQEKIARTGVSKPASTRPSPRETGQTNSLPAPGGSAKEAPRKTDAQEITELLTRRYNRNLRLYEECDSEDVLQIYLTSLAHVYDPHSDYFNKIEADNFAINMNLSLFGIGAELFSDDNGYCTIRRLIPGPAMKSGKIKENDRIVAVAQGDGPPVDVIGMALNKVVQMIRGPKDTDVRLTLMPVDDPSERPVVRLVREEIKLADQEAKAKVIELPDGKERNLRLGVIDLSSFYAPIDPGQAELKYTSVDVARLLKKLMQENVKGVILDLRRNGGGSLEEAVKLTGLFIKTGPVVLVKGAKGEVMEDDDPYTNALYQGPLIVLTSRFSASASEIFAGALQDYGRALIVGDLSTHGKGTVQQIVRLREYVKPATESATNDPGELKLTIRKFYRASGVSTQLKGVMPDIVLPSVWNYHTDVGESALENALMPGDPIPSSRFEKLNLVQPELAEMLRRSNTRVATNQDFAYIREDIEQFKKNQADKTVSLNEQQQLKEKQEADARQKARDSERRKRKTPEKIVHELTLSQVDLPGLPPPVQHTNTLAAIAPDAKSSPAVAGTRPASSTPKAVEPAQSLDADPENEQAPAVDPALEETENILVDYISLLSQDGMLTAGH